MALRDELIIWNENRKQDLIQGYNEKGFKASGTWERELEAVEEIKPNRINLKMTGTYYSYYMINGRGPSEKFPPMDAIRQWVEDKKIVLRDGMTKNQFAYLVARKIKEKGITPSESRKRLLTDVYTRERIEQLMTIIRHHVSFTAKAQIKLDLTKK